MKKILLTAMAALFAVGAVSAQDKGKWALGPQIGVYTNTGADGAIFGVGAWPATPSRTDGASSRP